MLNSTAKAWWIAVLVVYGLFGVPEASYGKNAKQNSDQLRADYLSRAQALSGRQADVHTTGSLWSPGGALVEMSADNKAARLNDNITIQVVEQTSATSTGDLTSQRTLQTQSAITGLGGHVSTTGVNPILAAQSATNVTGKGEADAGSQIQTNLSGRVIGLLANNNLVVEAQHLLVLNNQKETIIVRGIVRPSDITSANTVLSTQLANLEIELKGKGVVSDATRPPNPLTRAIMWLLGF